MARSETTRAVSSAMSPVNVDARNLTWRLPSAPGCFQKKILGNSLDIKSLLWMLSRKQKHFKGMENLLCWGNPCRYRSCQPKHCIPHGAPVTYIWPTWITESVPSFCGLIYLGSCFRFAGHFQQTVLPLPQQYNGTCELSFIRSLLRHLNSRQPVTPQFVPSHQWKPTTSPERKNTGGIDMDTFNV